MISQPRDTALTTQIEPVARWSNQYLQQYVSVLDDLAARIVTLVDVTELPQRARVHERGVEKLVDIVEGHTRAAELAIGHGFIAAPEVVDGLDRYMLWLQRDGSAIKRLRLNFDTSDLDAYDYVNMDWYTKPAEHRTAALTGPYLDYAGAGRLVITFTTPVFADDHFVGVVGTDVLAEELEALLTRRLRNVDAEVVLVSDDRTVVATNSPRWMPGERMRIHPNNDPGAYAAVVGLSSWTGWHLAVRSPIG